MIYEANKLAKYIGLEKVPKSWNIAFDKIKEDIPNEIKWLDREYEETVLKYYRINDDEFNKKYLKTIDIKSANIEDIRNVLQFNKDSNEFISRKVHEDQWPTVAYLIVNLRNFKYIATMMGKLLN